MNSTSQNPTFTAKLKTLLPGKKKILLVDDDPAIRRILFRLLMEEGFNVLSAANGTEALELADLMRFDLVLLDLNMPQKNGWETFEQLTVDHPLLPVVVITARSNQLFPALAAGVGALLEKPLDFVRLFAAIQHLLQEPPEVRQARLDGRPSTFSYIPSRENDVDRSLLHR